VILFVWRTSDGRRLCLEVVVKVRPVVAPAEIEAGRDSLRFVEDFVVTTIPAPKLFECGCDRPVLVEGFVVR